MNHLEGRFLSQVPYSSAVSHMLGRQFCIACTSSYRGTCRLVYKRKLELGPRPRAASKAGFEALRGGISIERAKERRIGRAEIQARNRRELRVIWERRRAENVVANSDRRGGESELGEPRPPPEPPD